MFPPVYMLWRGSLTFSTIHPLARPSRFAAHILVALFVALLAALAPAKASTALSFGPSLWNYSGSFIGAWEMRLDGTFEFGGSGRLEWGLYAPVLLQESYKPALPGITAVSSQKEYGWVSETEDPIYALIYLEKLQIAFGPFLAAIDHDAQRAQEAVSAKAYDSQSLYWGNPFLGPGGAFLSRYPVVEFHNAKVVVSDLLSDSKLVMAKGALRPFQQRRTYLLRDMKVNPMAWSDVINNASSDYGGGLDIQTGGFQGDMLLSGALFSGHLFQSQFLSEELSARFMAGLWASFPKVGGRVAYVNKSGGHPPAYYLSQLYAIRKENALASGTPQLWDGEGRRHGVMAGLNQGFATFAGFSLEAEIYPEDIPIGTLRLRYRIQKENATLSFYYLRENIRGASDLDSYRDEDCHIGFTTITAIVPETLFFQGDLYSGWQGGAPSLQARIAFVMRLGMGQKMPPAPVTGQ